MMKMQVLRSKLHFDQVLRELGYSHNSLFTKESWLTPPRKDKSVPFIFMIREIKLYYKPQYDSMIVAKQTILKKTLNSPATEFYISGEDLLTNDWMEICFSSHDDDSTTLTDKLTANEEITPGLEGFPERPTA